jgi:hypothetical protein
VRYWASRCPPVGRHVPLIATNGRSLAKPKRSHEVTAARAVRIHVLAVLEDFFGSEEKMQKISETAGQPDGKFLNPGESPVRQMCEDWRRS